MKFGFDLPSGTRGEMFVDGRGMTDDDVGRRGMGIPYYKLTS